MKGFAKIAAVLVAMTLVAGACSKKSTAPAAAPTAMHTMAPSASSSMAATGTVFTAHEFGIDGPDTLPAGTKDITLENQGAQDHEMIMFKVDDAHASLTADDIVNFVKNDPKAQPKWATVVGGVVPPIAHGATGKAIFGDFSGKQPVMNPNGELEPGTYFFACFVTDPTTKMPHAALGMVHKVTVS